MNFDASPPTLALTAWPALCQMAPQEKRIYLYAVLLIGLDGDCHFNFSGAESQEIVHPTIGSGWEEGF